MMFDTIFHLAVIAGTVFILGGGIYLFIEYVKIQREIYLLEKSTRKNDE
jgi:hypothetical protein